MLPAACSLPAAGEADMNALRQHINKGNAYLTAHHFTQALSEYEQALAVDPGNIIAKANIAAVHNSWGIAYFNQHKYKDALREWELCLKLSPNNRNAKGNITTLQRVLAQQGIDLDSQESAASGSDNFSEEVIGIDNNKPAPTGKHGNAKSTGAAGSVESYPGDAAGSSTAPDEPQQSATSLQSDKGIEQGKEAPPSESGDYGAGLILKLPNRHPAAAVSPQVVSSAPSSPDVSPMRAPLPSRPEPINSVMPNFASHVQAAPKNTFDLHASESPAIEQPASQPQSKQSPAEPESSLKVVPGGDKSSSDGAQPASLEGTLSALEMKVDGTTHADLSVFQRIERMEKLVAGKVSRGSMIERVDALRKEIGQ